MANSLFFFFVVVSLSISQQSFADEIPGMLDECKKSCEGSYPLHTYPKVSFHVKNHSEVFLRDYAISVVLKGQYWNARKSNIAYGIRLSYLDCLKLKVIMNFGMFSFRRSRCLLVNKGVGFLLSNNFKPERVRRARILLKYALQVRNERCLLIKLLLVLPCSSAFKEEEEIFVKLNLQYYLS